ncbi:MAG: hypothetical protein HYZ33_04915 [Ignavibacteriales bacterium]|nr:hypothetical protein [Ignavibacteriales bacterium]
MSIKLSKEAVFNQRTEIVSNFLNVRLSIENSTILAKEIIRGADGGSEIQEFDKWFNERFVPQVV